MYINVVYCHSLVPIRWKDGRPLKLTFFPFDLGLRINNLLHYTELRELVTAAVSFRKNVTFFCLFSKLFRIGRLGSYVENPPINSKVVRFFFLCVYPFDYRQGYLLSLRNRHLPKLFPPACANLIFCVMSKIFCITLKFLAHLVRIIKSNEA